MAKKEKKIVGKKVKDNQTDNEKLCAILSYLLIGIIWYLADEKMKQSSLAKYHVKQSLTLLIAWILYDIILGVLIWPLVVLSMGLLAPILMLLYYIPVILMIIGIINAATEKEKALPIIGKFAAKLSF